MRSLLHQNVINKTHETVSTSVAYVTNSIYVIQSKLDKWRWGLSRKNMLFYGFSRKCGTGKLLRKMIIFHVFSWLFLPISKWFNNCLIYDRSVNRLMLNFTCKSSCKIGGDKLRQLVQPFFQLPFILSHTCTKWKHPIFQYDSASTNQLCLNPLFCQMSFIYIICCPMTLNVQQVIC